MSRGSRLSIGLLLVLLAVPAVGEEDRVPILLRKILLLTPVEAAGTGLAPEVKLRATVDPRGRVSEVEVLAIQPASEYDEVFRQVTEETLSEWRYAPAIKDGQPVATTLEWSVQFKPRQGSPDEARSELLPLAADDPGARRARVLALPLEQRRELLRQHSQIAEKFLDRDRRQRFDSPRFVVVSDGPEPKTAEILASNLEAVFNVLHRLFQPGVEPQPESYKLVVYVFADAGAFGQMRSELEVYEWANGFYGPEGLLAFHLQMPGDALIGALLHEASHAFVDRHLVRPGYSLPLWLNEGFAEYVGNSEIKKGELLPGRTLKRRYVLSPFGVARARTGAGWNLETTQKAIRSGEGLTVEELATADTSLFYGEKRGLFYPTSWLLVHFLRHGASQWTEGEFPRFLLYAAEGYPPREALEAVYGTDAAELEARFRTYVKKL